MFVRNDVEQRLLDRMEGAIAAAENESDRSAAVKAALLVGLDFAVREGFLRILGDPPVRQDRTGWLSCSAQARPRRPRSSVSYWPQPGGGPGSSSRRF